MKNYVKTYSYPSLYYLYENLIRIHLFFKRITISEQFLKILVYYSMMGVSKSTEDYLLKEGVVKHKGNISNAKTLFKDLGLIEKIRNKEWKLNTPFHNLLIEDEINFIVKCKIKS